MATYFASHVITGNHASRPAATAVPEGTLYSCTDHGLIYQSDGAVWSTWATLGGGGGGPHASDHEDGGSDEINVTGLSGVLADPQVAAIHATSHENGGSDEINLAGLSGLLATPQTPAAHAASHQNGGADEISVAGLSGTLADPQTPSAHKTSHENGGTDEISVAGLSGLLADPQNPTLHGAAHELGGLDEIDVTGLTGLLATAQTPAAHSHAQGDVTGLVAALAALAPLASPALTGNPTAPTQAPLDNTTKIATTAYVEAAVAAGGGGYTTEQAQDDVGAMVDNSTIEYIDATPLLRVKDAGITYAKIQNISATQRILLRKTAAAGPTEEGTLSELLDFIGGATRGDILVRGAATWSRLALGTAGQRLKSDGTDLVWVDEYYTIPIWIGGNGSVITPGYQGLVHIDTGGVIVAATLLDADGLTGSIVVDLWKDTYTNHPATVADTITAAAKPTITAARKSQDTTLTGWTTALAAGDSLAVNVDSVSTFTKVLLSLKVRKT